jgi:hypothetical protein
MHRDGTSDCHGWICAHVWASRDDAAAAWGGFQNSVASTYDGLMCNCCTKIASYESISYYGLRGSMSVRLRPYALCANVLAIPNSEVGSQAFPVQTKSLYTGALPSSKGMKARNWFQWLEGAFVRMPRRILAVLLVRCARELACDGPCPTKINQQRKAHEPVVRKDAAVDQMVFLRRFCNK